MNAIRWIQRSLHSLKKVLFLFIPIQSDSMDTACHFVIVILLASGVSTLPGEEQTKSFKGSLQMQAVFA